MVSNTNIQTHLNAFKAPVCMLPVKLHDGLRTTIYVVRHKREQVLPKIVVFDEPTVLLDWCLEYEVDEGIVGGFDLRHHGDLLGEVWKDGGGSAQLVRRGRVLNKPRGQHEDHYPEGFPIRTAIIFEHR